MIQSLLSYLRSSLSVSSLCCLLLATTMMTTMTVAPLIGANATEDRIPPTAYKYQKVLHAEVERTWGLNIPDNAFAVSAGTIQQESAWNPNAASPYAKGLTQFTDPTWADVRSLDPTISADIWNPFMAIRAMTIYHHLLWSLFPTAVDSNNRWAFVLAAYNGGPGFVFKDQKLCAAHLSCQPNVWWGNVELYSNRSAAAFKENRGYPKAILKRWLPLYKYF